MCVCENVCVLHGYNMKKTKAVAEEKEREKGRRGGSKEENRERNEEKERKRGYEVRGLTEVPEEGAQAAEGVDFPHHNLSIHTK